MIDQVIFYILMFLGLFLVYLSIRNNWVLDRRCKHIDENLEEFEEVDKKFSYDDMLFRYLWIWDYNWFKENKYKNK